MSTAEPPVVEVSGGPGWPTASSLHELLAYHEVFWAFVVRQVKVRYKQAAIGIGWAVIQPLLSAALFAVFLGHVAKVGSDGAPYLLFSLCGMVAWTNFSNAATQSIGSLVNDQVLLRKVYFPRELLPFASVASTLVDILPGLAILLIAVPAYGITPAWSWLALPIPVVLLLLAATALGIGLSAINVYYRDVRYALPYILQLGLIVSPVVYALSAVPARYRTLFAIANPVAASIDGLRRIMLHGKWPQAGVTLGAAAWSVVAIAAGYVFFKRLERGFADRV